MPTPKQTSDYVVEPALMAAGLGAGAYYWWGADQLVRIGGNQVALWPILAGLGFVSTVAMNYVSNSVNEHLPEKYSILTHPAETAVEVAGTASILMAAEQVVSPGLVSDTFYPILGLAAVSKLGAKYIAHEYVMPWLDPESARQR